jgi:hypothetical protein
MSMAKFDHKWQPTSYNPNILTGLGNKSAEDYKKNFAMSDERYAQEGEPTPSVDFARKFEEGYKETLAVLEKCDPKGKVIKAFKGAPIAPHMILERSDSQPDILTASKFGGVPDLRRKLEFMIGHEKYLSNQYNKPLKSNVQVLKDIWPKDANGELMMFVAQLILPPEIIMPWDYFMGQLASDYNDVYCPLSGFERTGWLSPWTRGYYIFRSSMAPFFDPRLDCAMITECWFADEPDISKPPVMTEEEYLALVAEAIPQACATHHDSNVRWSDNCQTVTDIHIGFDFDIPSPYEWAGVPKISWEITDALREATDVCGYDNPVRMFGAPKSQQTPKRFMNTNAYMRPRAMAPWLCFGDSEHDYNWQINFCNFNRMESHTWGKIDGSCT